MLFMQPAFPAGAAITADQLVIVANRTVPESQRLARYYLEKRSVPRQNLLLIETSREELIGRKEYEKEIAAPVRRFLLKNDPSGSRLACLVLFYGIPLRVGPPLLDPSEKVRVLQLKEELSVLRVKNKTDADASPEQKKALRRDIARTEAEMLRVSRANEGASVDSELALVMETGYPLAGWIPNRFFLGYRGKGVPGMSRNALAVSRLDGPAEAVVTRMIDDSLFAEKNGLAGRAYFDARWPDPGSNKGLTPYQAYDRAIHDAARLVKKSGKMPVVLDERPALFGPGGAPDAVLYCGWYSLARYVDAFTWVRGAVGFHVASAECTTLRNPASPVWCRKMLEKGAAATLGPVAEPYLQSFPEPVIFFGCLLEGKSLVEAYLLANPFWSWQMVLIGDPLYRPFRPSEKK
jgi:uncharacterized protein (TIGR03790 family)